MLPKAKTHSSEKGFTIIELLIVIALIGILAGILVSVINYQEYMKQARDARRINDILTIQTAISSAVADNVIKLTDTTGCTSCDSISGNTAIDGTGWVRFTDLKGRGLEDFISVLPKDPANKDNLKLEYYSDGQRFEIDAVMESEKYQINATDDGGNDPAVYERGWDLKLH